MMLKVNGDPMEVAQGTTVGLLLEQLKLKPELVVVEHNLNILRREELPNAVLKEGDQVEIVHFVGGGSGKTTRARIERRRCTPRGGVGRAPGLRQQGRDQPLTAVDLLQLKTTPHETPEREGPTGVSQEAGRMWETQFRPDAGGWAVPRQGRRARDNEHTVGDGSEPVRTLTDEAESRGDPEQR